MSVLTDVCLAILYLLPGVIVLALALQVFFFPLRNIPTREQEAEAPLEEMLRVYAQYRRRCIKVACIYTLGAFGVWGAARIFELYSYWVTLGVIIALIAWMFVLGTSLLSAGTRRRHREGTYGQPSTDM